MGAAQSSRSTNAVIKSTAAATQLHDTGLAQNLRKIGQVNVQSPTEIQRVGICYFSYLLHAEMT